MQSWPHSGGFSVDGSVRLPAWDRGGLERLARYCARPAYSAERLDRWDGETWVYRLKRPLVSGETSLVLSPLELLSRLAALVPPPRRHGIHYYGVLSAHAKLREKVIESAGPSGAVALRLREAARRMNIVPLSPQERGEREDAGEWVEPEEFPRSFPYTWAMLLARIYDSFPLVCPRCGSSMRIIAFITNASDVKRILEHIGEASEPRLFGCSFTSGWSRTCWHPEKTLHLHGIPAGPLHLSVSVRMFHFCEVSGILPVFDHSLRISCPYLLHDLFLEFSGESFEIFTLVHSTPHPLRVFIAATILSLTNHYIAKTKIFLPICQTESLESGQFPCLVYPEVIPESRALSAPHLIRTIFRVIACFPRVNPYR
jgi:hypothetical protein